MLPLVRLRLPIGVRESSLHRHSFLQWIEWSGKDRRGSKRESAIPDNDADTDFGELSLDFDSSLGYSKSPGTPPPQSASPRPDEVSVDRRTGNRPLIPS